MTTLKTALGAHLSLSSPQRTTSAPDNAIPNEGIAPHLNADDVAELRAAIERSLCEGDVHSSPQTEVDVDLRKALRVSCAKARLQRVRAEQLLVDLKQVWMALPSMLTTRTEERLNRIVSACIDEYYTNHDPPPA